MIGNGVEFDMHLLLTSGCVICRAYSGSRPKGDISALFREAEYGCMGIMFIVVFDCCLYSIFYYVFWGSGLTPVIWFI